MAKTWTQTDVVALVAQLLSSGGRVDNQFMADVNGKSTPASYQHKMRAVLRFAKLVNEDRAKGGKGTYSTLPGAEESGMRISLCLVHDLAMAVLLGLLANIGCVAAEVNESKGQKGKPKRKVDKVVEEQNEDDEEPPKKREKKPDAKSVAEKMVKQEEAPTLVAPTFVTDFDLEI